MCECVCVPWPQKNVERIYSVGGKGGEELTGSFKTKVFQKVELKNCMDVLSAMKPRAPFQHSVRNILRV